MAGTVARYVLYVKARCRNVMYHVAAATLASIVVTSRLIAFAIRRAVVVDAVLDLLAHAVMHVLIQMIMVEAIIMKTVCIVGGNVG